MTASALHIVKSAFLALFLLLAGLVPVKAEVEFTSEPLKITTAKGKVHEFTVELALDNMQRQQGLMYRKQMDADRGMLFDFGRSRGVLMWMKNTYLPLDMLFIDQKGVIRTIHQNAEPLSEAVIDSKVPVLYVLELNAGIAKKLGLKPGNKVQSARIDKNTAKPKP
ncbi:DUF192 domain-containing protein [Pararhizobium sp.]|uniref:DUF192 domain-containing protein n=1 Tax=Pararhizobium sp. TaxID=1977563 RepID=UPI002718E56E|nr:DUF192 domain-containing protein [Pararhizobium sp.]MDO9415384.1 DUF192 domain-containing protein [Pararhizobium sp.]